MTILSSLKKLHKKMTGQETTSKTIGGVLDSMQENYSGGTGGGNAYEPLITLTINELTESDAPEGLYIYTLNGKDNLTTLDNMEIYFNSSEYPLIKQELEVDGHIQNHYAYHINVSTLVFEAPAYDLAQFEPGSDPNNWAFITTEQFNPGDTITILKKVSGSSSGDTTNNDFIITADLLMPEDADSSLENLSLTGGADEIAEAYQANKKVSLNLTIGNVKLDIPLTEIILDEEDGSTAYFGGIISGQGPTPGVLFITFDADDTPIVKINELN